MGLSEEGLKACWAWAGGRCECKTGRHGHTDRCNRELVWEQRGKRGRGAWEARLRQPPIFGVPATENCEILCRECYEVSGTLLPDD